MFMCAVLIKYIPFDFYEFMANLILLSKIKNNNIELEIYNIEKRLLNIFGNCLNDCYI